MKDELIPIDEIPANAEFWLNERGREVATFDGKAWLVFPGGVVPGFGPPVGAEDAWVKPLDKDEAFRRVGVRFPAFAAAQRAAV
jgi:hypothetical protein